MPNSNSIWLTQLACSGVKWKMQQVNDSGGHAAGDTLLREKGGP